MFAGDSLGRRPLLETAHSLQYCVAILCCNIVCLQEIVWGGAGIVGDCTLVAGHQPRMSRAKPASTHIGNLLLEVAPAAQRPGGQVFGQSSKNWQSC